MSRHEETIGRMPNPSQFYLEWDIKQNTFCYYSSESEQRMPFPLPFTFLALKFVNSITGYDESLKKGIYSNEVTDTRYEHFRVQYRDGSMLANGLYADIKDDLKRAGGKYTRSIYALTPKGVIVNIRLKGSQMINFGVIEKFGNRWRDEWIQVSSFNTNVYKEGDKETPYTTPVFTWAGTLTQADDQKAEKAYALVKDFFVSKPVQYGPTSAPRPVQSAPVNAAPQVPAGMAKTNDDDDLPF